MINLSDYLRENNITNTKLAVACSAGIDSMVLLYSLTKIYPLDLIYCIHVDHGWREDSQNALDFLKKKCTELNIKLLYHQFKFGELEQKENTARTARYELFNNFCNANQIPNLLLAHNLNDHVETILFRIFRGTNIKGLEGIPVTRSLNETSRIHRPFLTITRSEIEDYAKQERIEFIEDSSNTDTKFARNRIRLEILPEANKINPNFLQNINLLSQLIIEEGEFVNRLVDKDLNELGDLPWSLEKFRQLEALIQRRILEKIFTPQIEFVENFLSCIKEGGFHRINFKKGKFFTIKQKQIWLELE